MGDFMAISTRSIGSQLYRGQSQVSACMLLWLPMITQHERWMLMMPESTTGRGGGEGRGGGGEVGAAPCWSKLLFSSPETWRQMFNNSCLEDDYRRMRE